MSWTHYEDLIVWQKAMNLVDETYSLVQFLPDSEKYALSDQMRRSVISIPSNIAEGHGRRTDNEFKQFLSVARGSVCELETQIFIAIRQNYLSKESATTALSLCVEIRKILTKLMF